MIRIDAINLHVTAIHTRLPFRYGIAEMTAAPHVVVEIIVSEGSTTARGFASEHLPPKWFTKDPDSLFVDDVEDLVVAIESAAELASDSEAASLFELWWSLQERHAQWATSHDVPGLVAGLGTSLIERALIDATCRLIATPFVRAIHTDTFGIELGRIHPELEGHSLADFAPERCASTIAIRHTVGLSDPLTDDEVRDDPHDGLPVSLAAVLARYGAKYLKIKTAGNASNDIPRLKHIDLVCREAGISPEWTIDGNESMTTAADLREWLEALTADSEVDELLREKLIAIEQPIHRSHALDESSRADLQHVSKRFLVIIDESDDALDTVRRAMDLGYAGGTYKGCKGVIRGLANAALIKSRAAPNSAAAVATILTAEDLSTVAPLTINQDLVVAAAMGLTHIERNGHHYWGAPAPLSPIVDELLESAHPDSFARVDDGPARLVITDGEVLLDSILDAPFGTAFELDVSTLEPLTIESARRIARG
ncbi:hypothetical protein A20C1_12687 [marine actinobacterium PHSC20C1]|nr:hypothetical protein A20C1_12687 [marine actinobacterium PHSC20C1]